MVSNKWPRGSVTALQAPSAPHSPATLGCLQCDTLGPHRALTYHVIAKEPIVVILPSDHRPAEEREIDTTALEGETLIGFSDLALVRRAVADGYLRGNGVDLTPSHRIENFAAGLSLVASIRGVALLPAYIEPLLLDRS
jgi:LysR family hca operon transcriptional activator